MTFIKSRFWIQDILAYNVFSVPESLFWTLLNLIVQGSTNWTKGQNQPAAYFCSPQAENSFQFKHLFGAGEVTFPDMWKLHESNFSVHKIVLECSQINNSCVVCDSFSPLQWETWVAATENAYGGCIVSHCCLASHRICHADITQ